MRGESRQDFSDPALHHLPGKASEEGGPGP